MMEFVGTKRQGPAMTSSIETLGRQVVSVRLKSYFNALRKLLSHAEFTSKSTSRSPRLLTSCARHHLDTRG